MKTFRKEGAFTLVELLVVISIVAVLVAVLLPALSKSRDQVYTVQCLSNLRQIGLADTTYSQQNNDWFVRSTVFVTQLAYYTNTSPDFHRWQGYGIDKRPLYQMANPFKCPLVKHGTVYDGPYGQGIKSLTGSDITDYALNTANHHSPSTNDYITWKRVTDLVHGPSDVLNYADAVGGGFRIDYSNFRVDFRHNQFELAPLLYVDGHAIGFRKQGIVTSTATFNRGGNNTAWVADRPYFWW